MRRDGKAFIGGDFPQEEASSPATKDEIKTFCKTRIEPGDNLKDTEALDFGPGSVHEYCVRALIVDDKGAKPTGATHGSKPV